MNAVIKISILLISIICAIYFIGSYLMPSVTVRNLSNTDILEVTIDVPNSSMDFGSIAPRQQNTIRYFWDQRDGTYEYRFTLESGVVLEGACGYVSSGQFRRRFEILLKEGNEVDCNSGI